MSFFSFHNTAILDLDELQCHRSMLVTAFNFNCNWLVSECFAISMLSSQYRDNILNIKSGILAKLHLDSNNLGCIVEVLKRKPILYRETIALLEGKNYSIKL